MNRQGCEKMETPDQTKPNLRRPSQVPGLEPRSSASWLLKLQPFLLPHSCPAGLHLPRTRPPEGAVGPPPHILALAAHSPGCGRTRAEARHPLQQRGLGVEWLPADAHRTSPRRAQVTVLRAQAPPSPHGAAPAAGAAGLPRALAPLPARRSLEQKAGRLTAPPPHTRGARDWTPLLPGGIALGFRNLKN